MPQVWEGSVSGSAVGIGLSLASVLCGAAMLSFSGRALSEKLDVFRCSCPRCVHVCMSLSCMHCLACSDQRLRGNCPRS